MWAFSAEKLWLYDLNSASIARLIEVVAITSCYMKKHSNELNVICMRQQLSLALAELEAKNNYNLAC